MPTYICHPDAYPGWSTVDGCVSYENVGFWDVVHGADGDTARPAVDTLVVRLRAAGIANKWYSLNRSIMLFDISNLGSIQVDKVTLGIYGRYKRDQMGLFPSINIFSSNPESNIALVATDYATLGDTPLSFPIGYENFNVDGWNYFTLNTAGRTLVQSASEGDGMVKLGAREASYDAPNRAPEWPGTGNPSSEFWFWSADKGDIYKPQLIIEYTAVPPKISPLIDIKASIIQFFNTASDFFYLIYRETYDWIFPFSFISEPFYALCLLFNKLAWAFYYLGEWLDAIVDQIALLLTWDNIKAFILSWIPDLPNIIEWFADKAKWVTDIITTWWSGKLAELTIWWESQLIELRAMKELWDTFWTVTLPYLLSFQWLEDWWQGQLIELGAWWQGQLRELLFFYNEFVELWDGIKEFFADPLQWLYNKLDEWFERFW